MKLVLAPEPAAWLAPLLDSLDRRDCLVVAPWALPGGCSAQQRQVLRGVRRVAVPGWGLSRGVLRRAAVAWGGGADLRLTLELRQALDGLVARWLPRGLTHVFAPSLTALRTFAAAPEAECLSLQDLPALRQLHRDLDDASDALPAASFLRNFRAPLDVVARQEQEHVLARRVLVGGHYARRLVTRRLPRERVGALPALPPALRLDSSPDSRFVLLAGTTASRHGLEVALAAVEQTTGLTLLARRGPGSLERSLTHPRLRLVEGAGALPPLRAVVAPAWAEGCAVETAAAAHGGVPLLATDRARGWCEATLVPPGDARALARALSSALARRVTPASPAEGPTGAQPSTTLT
ncbi:MAG: hypothetical protein INH41_19050 [Myxococcaceae bacterium]|jgi:hypothetical protein|nr:hypothetical protein [Myxococcaceae bacterium]MCA3014485.1 hypothetical protein [Myxococcaceae bacterium]